MKTIKLTKNKFAIVDDDLFEELDKYKWHYVYRYAARRDYFGGNKKPEYIFMHKLINNTPEGFDTDHINRNTLDNRRSNLRSVTHQQNAFNSSLSKNSRSGYKGVSWDKKNNSWKAHLTLNNKYIHLGRYVIIEDAINARKEAEAKYHAI